MAERAGRPLQALQAARDGAQDVLGERQGEGDRRQVGDQQVLRHVR
jgi:hypothetical protein